MLGALERLVTVIIMYSCFGKIFNKRRIFPPLMVINNHKLSLVDVWIYAAIMAA